MGTCNQSHHHPHQSGRQHEQAWAGPLAGEQATRAPACESGPSNKGSRSQTGRVGSLHHSHTSPETDAQTDRRRQVMVEPVRRAPVQDGIHCGGGGVTGWAGMPAQAWKVLEGSTGKHGSSRGPASQVRRPLSLPVSHSLWRSCSLSGRTGCRLPGPARARPDQAARCCGARAAEGVQKRTTEERQGVVGARPGAAAAIMGTVH